MVDLPPAAGRTAEDARGADRQVEPDGAALEAPPLPAHRVEDRVRPVDGVVVELDEETAVAPEEPLVHRADGRPAARDAAQRIVHHRVIGRLPVLGQ